MSKCCTSPDPPTRWTLGKRGVSAAFDLPLEKVEGCQLSVCSRALSRVERASPNCLARVSLLGVNPRPTEDCVGSAGHAPHSLSSPVRRCHLSSRFIAPFVTGDSRP